MVTLRRIYKSMAVREWRAKLGGEMGMLCQLRNEYVKRGGGRRLQTVSYAPTPKRAFIASPCSKLRLCGSNTEEVGRCYYITPRNGLKN